MIDENKKAKCTHNLILNNRNKLNITGVSDVDNFDDQTATVYTDYGQLTIRGQNLHVSKLNLDTGEVELDGIVDALIYTSNAKTKPSLFSKIFK